MPGIFTHIRHNWRARTARRELESLSDQQLHDIGITRDRIADFVHSFPRPVSRRGLV